MSGRWTVLRKIIYTVKYSFLLKIRGLSGSHPGVRWSGANVTTRCTGWANRRSLKKTRQNSTLG